MPRTYYAAGFPKDNDGIPAIYQFERKDMRDSFIKEMNEDYSSRTGQTYSIVSKKRATDLCDPQSWFTVNFYVTNGGQARWMVCYPYGAGNHQFQSSCYQYAN